MRLSPAVRAGLVMMAAALVAAGCDDPGEVRAGPRATASAAPSERPTATPTVPRRFVPDARSVFDADDDVLEVAIQDPTSLDPMRIGNPGSVLVVRQLYESLTRWDPEQGKVVPAAAQSWKVAGGGRRFTFRLRKDMRFHDGSRVTANSFKFAFDRIAKKRNASDIAYTLDNVEGFEAVNETGTASGLSGVIAAGPRTLVIRMTRPYRELPAVLTHPGLVPLPPKPVAKAAKFSRVPVGNGPFRIAKPWTPGRTVVLKSFGRAIRTAGVDGIRLVPYPDAAASWIPFADGDLDVAEVPAGQVSSAEDAFGRAGFKPLLAGYYFGFNFKLDRYKDIRLRRAVSLAIDRDAISTGVYKGTLQPARGIVPAGLPGFAHDACAGRCSHEPDKARALVSKLPKKARTVTLEFDRGVPHGRVAEAVRRDLRRVGLRVKLRGMSFSRYVRRLRDDDHGFYRLGWLGEYPTADVFLSPLFRSGAANNHAGFESAKVDKLLARAHRQSSPAARRKLYVEIERELLRRATIVPIGYFVTHWAAGPRVESLTFDVMGGFDAVTASLSDEG